ncbi:uncharacterized protein LOC123011175 [Tribolium madens]|uniref:uncharacterized protein LOC123011175 n=1 Tax=Tribolium madens TaxID=41895 RepID=UPI001CF757D0|nr:uncharacterized protein LOC123011175 [Tribolium madens]
MKLPLALFLLTWTLCEGASSWSRSWHRTWNTVPQPSQSSSWSRSWNTQQSSSVPQTKSSNNKEVLSGDNCSGDCNTSIQTCPSCINTCSSSCASNLQCLKECLNQCNCENPELVPEPETPCCQILHPPTCFSDDYGNNQCIIRRHKECSSKMCTSPVVSIQPGGNSRGCHYINNYPYVYCGNYERHDCGQCYSCEGSWNPQQCSKTSGCTEGCRKTM